MVAPVFSGNSASAAIPPTVHPPVSHNVPYLKSSKLTSSSPIPNFSDVNPDLFSSMERETG